MKIFEWQTNIEKLENRNLLSATSQSAPTNTSNKPPNLQNTALLKIEVVWPPKLKNPPRILIEPILRPKVFLGAMNPNDSFWYFSNSSNKYRWNFKIYKESNIVVIDNPLKFSIQDSNLKFSGNSILSFKTE